MPLIVLILLLLLSTPWLAHAQEATEAGTAMPSTLPSQMDDSASMAVSNEEIPSSAAIPEEITGRYAQTPNDDAGNARANVLSGGVGVSGFLDDNALDRSTHPVRDLQYAITPAVALQHIRPRASLKVDYAGGAAMNRRFTSRNIISHALSTEAALQLSRHVRLNLHQDYSHASNPFQQYGTTLTDSLHGTAQVNDWVIPAATRSLLEAGAGLEWQYGPHSTVGVTADGSRLRFARDAANPNLLSADSAGARAYFAHRLSRRHSFGASLQALTLRSIGISSHTQAQAAQLLYVFDISRNINLSWYGGPQHLTTRSSLNAQLPADANHWFPASGMSLAWRAPHVDVRVAYDQSVTDGGGITPAVRLHSLEGTFSAQVSRSNRIRLMLGAADNHSLYVTANTLTGFQTVQGAFSFEHQLLPNLWGSVRYAHARLNRRGPSTLSDIIDHNRFETGIDYRFARPWGR